MPTGLDCAMVMRMTTPGRQLFAGPIAVTGSGGQVGTALCRRLASFPSEVRLLGRGDDLAAAFRDAVAVVHLAGGLRPKPPDTYAEANLATVERTVAALTGSPVERVVFLSYVSADRASGNAYLRAKAVAEELLFRSGRDCVVFRCTHVFGPPDDPGPTVAGLLGSRSGDRPVWILGDGRQRVAPVYRDDVVDAVVAALDPRSYHGRFDLPGPEELSMDEFVRIVAGGGDRLHHVPPRVARGLSHAVPGLTPELVDLLLSDSVGEQHRAERTFGLERRGVREVYRPAAELAA
jgi:uncharacterized protein YbjT (DUF2867 family)